MFCALNVRQADYQMKNKFTRREFLKTASLTAGWCVFYKQFVCAQPGLLSTRPQGILPIRWDNPAIKHHLNRCWHCEKCDVFCRDESTVFGHTTPPGEDACIYCGQCTLFCPAQAITEQYHYQQVAEAIADRGKIVVASVAPSVRVALGEMYGLAPGQNVEGKIVGALTKLGVDYVLDVTFAADLAVMEEASELLVRLENNNSDNPLPMFTSCCPAWVRFAKLFYPDLLPNISTIKSPVMLQGALVKTYFAQKTGIDPAKIINVALTPCTAKKAEIRLPGMQAAGVAYRNTEMQGAELQSGMQATGAMHVNPEMQDVDIALTCRELAILLNEGGVDFLETQEAPYHSLMGDGSGAGIIFGGTGGAMEATLRTAYKLLNDKNPPDNFYHLTSVRGFDSLRQASVKLGTRTLNVAVVHGTKQARQFLETIKNGTQKFDFVEVMACTGGCIGGGGQPINRDTDATMLKQLRQNALYQNDAGKAIRLSCDNPQIRLIYNDFLGEPLSQKSKELLHIF